MTSRPFTVGPPRAQDASRWHELYRPTPTTADDNHSARSMCDRVGGRTMWVIYDMQVPRSAD